MNENGLPLGIMRQAVMKLDSFIGDIRECAEEDGISQEEKAQFEYLAEIAGNIQASLMNMVMEEMGEEDFLNEQPEMDAIDMFPGTESDIMEEEI